MTSTEPSFTLGIEEEYLLVDLETMDLANDPPPSLMDTSHLQYRPTLTGNFPIQLIVSIVLHFFYLTIERP